MPKKKDKIPVGLVGAGFIARSHLEALKWCPHAEARAVCDPDLGKARSLARGWSLSRVYSSMEEMIGEAGVRAVHILTPPALHAPLARKCLEAGLPCLVEKPLALEAGQARELRSLAEEKGVLLAVNHNMVFFPGVPFLKKEVERGRLGRLERILLVHNAPLRQLSSGDFSHFMFRGEGNILWEQGVHLFSLVQYFLGPAREITARTSPPLKLANGGAFREEWDLSLSCEKGEAGIHMAFGKTMPETWIYLLGSDGAARVDLVRGNWERMEKTAFLDFLDQAWNGIAQGGGLFFRGLAKIPAYGLSLFGIAPSWDPFSKGMLGSVKAFHRALALGKEIPTGARQAEEVISMCEASSKAANAPLDVSPFPAPPDPGPPREGEVVVTGGTGFLGRAVVEELLEAGVPVTVTARRRENLPLSCLERGVRFFQGDAMDRDALERALEGARVLLHLATCAPSDPSGIEEGMKAGARTAWDACAGKGVGRLVFASSTAALYLGGKEPVKGSEGPDSMPGKRPAYARGKIAAEKVLRELSSGETGPEVVILRPAIVVGKGGIPEHSGVGLWVRDNHCVGWGTGRRPLPFLLVGDWARAAKGALFSGKAAGKAYNLAGGVRISAREYIYRLRLATGRAYRFHPRPLWVTWTAEKVKEWIKRLARKEAPKLTWRDLKSRAFLAPLDTSDAEEDLDWKPTADMEVFHRDAFLVHAPGRDRER